MSTTDTHAIVVRWIVDGFLHPPTQVATEFVDVDDFLRVPVPSLSDEVQFARLKVDVSEMPVEHIVIGTEGLTSRPEIARFLADRHPSATLTFLVEEKPCVVQVLPESHGLAEGTAACVAVTRYSLAWDDGNSINVSDGTTAFDVSVEYANGQYLVICRRVP